MRVPRYDEPQVEQRAAPTIRQNPNDYTGRAQQTIELAQAAGQAGDAVARAAMRMQDRDDMDALNRVEATVLQDYQQNFEGPARERRGHKALGLGKEANDWWTKAGQKYNESLTTERQRRLFSNKVLQLSGQSVDAMATYEAGQKRQSLNDSTNASIVGETNLAAANPGNAEIQARAKANIEKKLTILGDLNGYDEATLGAKRGEALTQFHGQILEGIIDSNPSAARAYFDANKGEIDGSAHAEFEKRLKSGTLRSVAQEAADGYVGAGLTESEALARARKEHAGDDEAAIVAEVKTRFTERDQARDALQQRTADDAWKLYADGGYKREAIPNSMWARLDGRTKIAIDADYAGRLSGKDIKTNWDVYDKLRTMARDEPRNFAKVDLRPYFPSLGTTEREALTDLKDGIVKGDSNVATLSQQLSNVHDLMDWGDGDREKKGQLDSAVMNALSAEEKVQGKPLDFDARQKVIDRMVLESSGFFGKRYYEVYGTEGADNFEPEIPRAERTKIEAALKRAGKPISDDEVLRMFKRKHGLP